MNETFSQYLINVGYTYVSERAFDWRYGQTCFNVLYELDSDLANSIRGTELDPFYNDDIVPEFLARLRDEWDDQAMSYPDWPATDVTCMTTRAGVECTARTKVGIVKLSATATEDNESTARAKAERELGKKVRQRQAYDR